MYKFRKKNKNKDKTKENVSGRFVRGLWNDGLTW